MRKGFVTYLIIWIISFILFNAVVFAIPTSIDGETIINIVKTVSAIKGGTINSLDIKLIQLADYLMNSGEKELVLNKFGGAFWPGYISIIVAYIGQIFCTYRAFLEKNSQKFFYNVSIIRVSYIGLIITTIVGIACMFVPDVPLWLGSVVCIIVLLFVLVAILKANLAVEIVTNKDEEVKNKTMFVKQTQERLKSINLNNDKYKNDMKLLLDEIRYSDPMSIKETYDIEKDIDNKISSIKENIEKDLDIKELVEETYKLIEERNNTIKALK